jgi:hypothetical protein
MKFSMIVEMTSLTPRYALSSAAIPAQAAPTSTPTRMITAVCSTGGSATAPPTIAATHAASRNWPSTPMLNSFIWKPIATARPAR